MSSMTADEYDKLTAKEKEHFARCAKCGEILDPRSLDEALFHTDHKTPPRYSVLRVKEAGHKPAETGSISTRAVEYVSNWGLSDAPGSLPAPPLCINVIGKIAPTL
jgi:hypothetical protein